MQGSAAQGQGGKAREQRREAGLKKRAGADNPAAPAQKRTAEIGRGTGGRRRGLEIGFKALPDTGPGLVRSGGRSTHGLVEGGAVVAGPKVDDSDAGAAGFKD